MTRAMKRSAVMLEPRPAAAMRRPAAAGAPGAMATDDMGPRHALQDADGWELALNDGERRHLLRSLTALTDREREVACAVCCGGPNEAVADRLCIALPTLRTHLMRINQKLGTTSKSDLVRYVSSRLLDGYRCGEIIRGPESEHMYLNRNSFGEEEE